MKRTMFCLIVALAAGCGRPFPWERPESAKGPAARPLVEADQPPTAEPDWTAGLSDEVRQEMEGLAREERSLVSGQHHEQAARARPRGGYARGQARRGQPQRGVQTEAALDVVLDGFGRAHG